MHNRWKDAKNILKRYQSMGIFPKEIEISDETFEELGIDTKVSVEKILLLTNANVPERSNENYEGALGYYKDNYEFINKLLEKYNTKLVRANGNYNEEFNLEEN